MSVATSAYGGVAVVPTRPARAPAYPIASVDNALRLMLLFGDRQVLRLSEASEALGIVRSTAHRLLAMLQHHGFIEQDPGSRAYVAVPALSELGLASMQHRDVMAAARPVMSALAAELDAATHLCLLRGRNVAFTETVENRAHRHAAGGNRRSFPAHCLAGGQALLAEIPFEAVALLYGGHLGAGLTEHSIGTFEALEHALAEVRVRGWAVSFEQRESGVGEIAAAIRTGPSRPRAAVAVSLPLDRLREDRVASVARLVLRAAMLVERGLPRARTM
jgi:IclR family acetate operon transcriptional repressor